MSRWAQNVITSVSIRRSQERSGHRRDKGHVKKWREAKWRKKMVVSVFEDEGRGHEPRKAAPRAGNGKKVDSVTEHSPADNFNSVKLILDSDLQNCKKINFYCF